MSKLSPALQDPDGGPGEGTGWPLAGIQGITRKQFQIAVRVFSKVKLVGI